MFLDEILYNRAKQTDLSNEESCNKALVDMVNDSLNHLFEQVGNKKTEEMILPILQRMCNTWEQVRIKLEKENIFLIKKDGFKEFITIKFPSANLK